MDNDINLLEQNAKQSLDDISNQNQSQARWLNKTIIKKNVKTIKLPTLLHNKKFKYFDKDDSLLIRKNIVMDKKFNMKYYDCNEQNNHRIDQVLKIVKKKKKQVYHYNLNQHFTSKLSQANFSQRSSLISKANPRLLTQPILLQSHLSHSFSLNGQLSSIRQLIIDKRNKCRKLSKQGYLILKNRNDCNSINMSESIVRINHLSKLRQFRLKGKENIIKENHYANKANHNITKVNHNITKVNHNITKVDHNITKGNDIITNSCKSFRINQSSFTKVVMHQ